MSAGEYKVKGGVMKILGGLTGIMLAVCAYFLFATPKGEVVRHSLAAKFAVATVNAEKGGAAQDGMQLLPPPVNEPEPAAEAAADITSDRPKPVSVSPYAAAPPPKTETEEYSGVSKAVAEVYGTAPQEANDNNGGRN